MELANVAYFGNKANRLLGIDPSKYTSQRLINIEFLCTQVRNIYNQIHRPNSSYCRLPLSVRFSNASKMVVDKTLVDTVLTYLQEFNKVCQCQCACTECNCAWKECNCDAWNCTCCEEQSWDCNCKHCPGWPVWNDHDCSGECNCNCDPIECHCDKNCNCDKTNCNCDCECTRTCAPYECSTGNCNCNCYP